MTATTIRVQMVQRKDTAANWTAANPILLSGEIGYETDTEKFKIGDGTTNWNGLDYLPIPDGSGNLTITGNLEIGTTGTLTFEGSTANDFETTLAVTDPTADRTITLPNVSGTVVTTGDTGSVTSAMLADGTIVDADVSATAEIAVSKLANGTANQVLVTDGTDVSWSDDLTLAGNLTVNGTTTTVNTQTLVVEDKNIELGVVGTPTDLTADGGGITLKGTTDKTINWVDATDSWTSSEHVDLAIGKSYRINGTEVLSGTTLGSGVTGSSLTSVGTLGSLTVTGSATAGTFIPTSGTAPTNGLYLPSSNNVAISTNTSERVRIDSSGRLLAGVSSSFQIESLITPKVISASSAGSGDCADLFVGSFQNATGSGRARVSGKLFLAHSRSGTTGSIGGLVGSSDRLGEIRFAGDDGTQFLTAAEILGEVDGIPGANDMPGRLVFSVTADGASSPTEAMRINNAGELLIGYTSDNGAYKLQVNSQIFATSATIATSDGRYKENVATLDGCVDLVKALRPVSFDWKHQEPITRIDDGGETVVVREAHNFPDGTQVGFIAQEVETVLADKPWLGSVIKQNVRPAVTDNDGNELAPEEEFLGIAEGNLVAVLTSALKEALGEIESLKARVAALESS